MQSFSSLNPNQYIQRCFELAARAGGEVGANPHVGCVIVKDDVIIGEGWHKKFGGAHAEVEAVNTVVDKTLLKECTMYVSLEPCNFIGKTPACTDLILKYQIPKVVIGSLDPNPIVSGGGIQLLRDKGVEVEVLNLTDAQLRLNRHFYLNLKLNRPYILAKWAETADGFIGRSRGGRLMISGEYALQHVHYLRSQYQAIMVGRNTALRDNPELNLRRYYGASPVRIVFDIDCSLPVDLKMLNVDGQVIVLNKIKNETVGKVIYFCPEKENAFFDLQHIFSELYTKFNIGSIMIEGGRFLLQQLINQNLVDELMVFRNNRKQLGDVFAPQLPPNFMFDSITQLDNDFLFHKIIDRKII